MVRSCRMRTFLLSALIGLTFSKPANADDADLGAFFGQSSSIDCILLAHMSATSTRELFWASYMKGNPGTVTMSFQTFPVSHRPLPRTAKMAFYGRNHETIAVVDLLMAPPSAAADIPLPAFLRWLREGGRYSWLYQESPDGQSFGEAISQRVFDGERAYPWFQQCITRLSRK
jgi:hypothetical protein